jgi:hypothetical protein
MYFPKKGWYFSMVSYLLSSDYTNEFQPSILQRRFCVATVFKRATIKFQTCGFASVMKASFNFVLGGYGLRTSNFRYFYILIF